MSMRTATEKERTRIVHMLCILVIVCLFAISALILLNVGVRVYRNIAMNNLDTFELRTSVSFVATKIHRYDAEGKVYLTTKDGVDTLVLEEDLDGVTYETRLYHMDGKLYELYQEQGLPYELSDGMEIMDIASFSIVEIYGNKLLLTASNASGETQSMYVTLRAGEDLAAGEGIGD